MRNIPAGMNCIPNGHRATQLPAVHVCAARQTRPHAPQFDRLVCVLVSHPLAAFASQSPYPAEQVKVQAEPTHPGVALAGRTQRAPHRPQWVTSVAVFVSHPFATLPSQSPNPAVHAMVHNPPVQPGVPPTEEHRMPHPAPAVAPVIPPGPQFLTSVNVTSSHPFASLPSQLPVPAPHVTDDTRQVPPVQRAVTPAGVGQRIPQPPQLLTLPMPTLVSHPLDALPSHSP